MSAPLFLTAKEAAAELNVSLPTLYAYVSRGMIRSEARGGRSRLYRAEDVRALIDRRDRDDGRAGAALQWGAPVLESALTLITGDALYYRGRDAVRLAGQASLETVAALLWDCDSDPFDEPPPEIPQGWLAGRNATQALKPLDRCLALLPIAAAADPRAHALTADGSARTGARVLRWIAAILADRKPSAGPVHQLLSEGWKLGPEDADLIRHALVLCADHELNPSAFTVRCVASTGASPYGSVLAGLAALRGPRHGGVTERVGALLTEFLAAPDPVSYVADRLQRGDGLPGFGHPLYPAGDVRGRALLRLVSAHHFDNPLIPRIQSLAQAGTDLSGQAPTIDFALSVLCRVLGLPADAPLTLFAAGRVAGWIGHHREQAAGGELIRPRARYTGRRP